MVYENSNIDAQFAMIKVGDLIALLTVLTNNGRLIGLAFGGKEGA